MRPSVRLFVPPDPPSCPLFHATRRLFHQAHRPLVPHVMRTPPRARRHAQRQQAHPLPLLLAFPTRGPTRRPQPPRDAVATSRANPIALSPPRMRYTSNRMPDASPTRCTHGHGTVAGTFFFFLFFFLQIYCPLGQTLCWTSHTSLIPPAWGPCRPRPLAYQAPLECSMHC